MYYGMARKGNASFHAGRAAPCKAGAVGFCHLPGLEEEVVGDVGLRVQKGLQVAVSVYQLTLPQSQAPLLDVHDHWIRQMALHHEERAENHLEKSAEAEVRQSTQSDELSREKKWIAVHHCAPTPRVRECSRASHETQM